MKIIVLFLLRIYINVLSFDRGLLRVFATGKVCKHSPTCSTYTYDAVSRYGIVRGLKLGVGRISKCR